MVQTKTLPDTPKAHDITVQDHCMDAKTCGMLGDETVYGPATVGGSKVVYDKKNVANKK